MKSIFYLITILWACELCKLNTVSVLTCHGYLSCRQEVSDGGGEGHVEDDVRVEERQGEHDQGGREVDQIIDTEGHHKPEQKCCGIQADIIITCRKFVFFSSQKLRWQQSLHPDQQRPRGRGGLPPPRTQMLDLTCPALGTDWPDTPELDSHERRERERQRDLAQFQTSFVGWYLRFPRTFIQ